LVWRTNAFNLDAANQNFSGRARRKNYAFWLIIGSPNFLRGFHYACTSDSKENKRICCCVIEPTLQLVSFNQVALWERLQLPARHHWVKNAWFRRLNPSA